MELLLICPRCRTNISLVCQSCQHCGADLRNLPPQDRHYVIIRSKGEETTTSGSEVVPQTPPETMDFMSPNPIETKLESTFQADKDVSLCEALDRILNKGAVLFGEVLISVADIDLIYLGLQVVLSSMETARGFKPVYDTIPEP